MGEKSNQSQKSEHFAVMEMLKSVPIDVKRVFTIVL